MLVHLGMSGRVIIGSALGEPAKHDHIAWWFETPSGERLEVRLNDPRRFGLVEVVADRRLSEHPLLAHLGAEPLDAAFSVDLLRSAAAGARRSVKSLLMDARVVVGIGNIYVSEALWRARVLPGTRAGRISRSRWRRIRAATVDVLAAAIEAGGTTLRDYRDPEGNLGYFATALDVYGREGESCRRCGGTVRRRVDLGRSTFYCPGCQH
jgi:formamidopyrimidine-DNA glycosylase